VFESRQGQNFFFLHNDQTDSGAHPASELKWPVREVDHSLPSSAEVKNGGAIPMLPHMSSKHSA
jgi:hypothetical protein